MVHTRGEIMAILIKPLTDTQVKQAKYNPTASKNQNLRDGNGLFLQLTQTGRKVWYIDYRRPYTKKRTCLKIGEYPHISLKEARELCNGFKSLLKQKIDPKEWLLEQEIEGIEKQGKTFLNVAKKWRDDYQSKRVTPHTMREDWRRLENYIFPKIANVPVHKVNSYLIITILQEPYKAGKTSVIEKGVRTIGAIMDFAENCGMIETHNCHKAIKAFILKPAKNMPTIKPSELPALIKTLKNARNREQIRPQTYLLFCWQLLTGVRPSEAINAEWSEIDFKQKIWNIPKEKMKGTKDQKRPHSVPLSILTIQVLQQMKQYTGDRRFIFQSLIYTRSNRDNPMSQETLNKVFKENGYKDRLTTHGIRSIISTYLNEQGVDPDIVETVLAHRINGRLRRVYNRSDYLEARKPVMQKWAEYCKDCGLAII